MRFCRFLLNQRQSVHHAMEYSQCMNPQAAVESSGAGGSAAPYSEEEIRQVHRLILEDCVTGEIEGRSKVLCRKNLSEKRKFRESGSLSAARRSKSPSPEATAWAKAIANRVRLQTVTVRLLLSHIASIFPTTPSLLYYRFISPDTNATANATGGRILSLPSRHQRRGTCDCWGSVARSQSD